LKLWWFVMSFITITNWWEYPYVEQFHNVDEQCVLYFEVVLVPTIDAWDFTEAPQARILGKILSLDCSIFSLDITFFFCQSVKIRMVVGNSEYKNSITAASYGGQLHDWSQWWSTWKTFDAHKRFDGYLHCNYWYGDSI
jgi:hypothetical protein